MLENSLLKTSTNGAHRFKALIPASTASKASSLSRYLNCVVKPSFSQACYRVRCRIRRKRVREVRLGLGHRLAKLIHRAYLAFQSEVKMMTII